MKKLLFAVTALAALSLLAPSTGFAQGALNQLGCYSDDAMTLPYIAEALTGSHDVYVVLSNPYDHATDTEIMALGGIEFQVTFEGGGVLGSFSWIPQVVDVGSGGNHIAGFGAPLVVGGGGFVTIGVQPVVIFADTPSYLYLTPASPSSIPGELVCLYTDETFGALYPSSGDTEVPVFAFNEAITATDVVHMDEIKAMYR